MEIKIKHKVIYFEYGYLECNCGSKFNKLEDFIRHKNPVPTRIFRNKQDVRAERYYKKHRDEIVQKMRDKRLLEGFRSWDLE